MKSIKQHELFEHLSGFLSARGIALQEGRYTQRIQQGCTLLSDAINLSQQGLGRAKAEVDKKLDQMRQVIHEKTAPAAPPATPGAAKRAAKKGAAAPRRTSPSRGKSAPVKKGSRAK